MYQHIYPPVSFIHITRNIWCFLYHRISYDDTNDGNITAADNILIFVNSLKRMYQHYLLELKYSKTNASKI